MKFYSDITSRLYDTMAEAEAAEAEFLKKEEDKKNANKVALQEIDLLFNEFNAAQKAQEEAHKAVVAAAKTLQNKYVDYQRNYGRLPDKYYVNWILTKML